MPRKCLSYVTKHHFKNVMSIKSLFRNTWPNSSASRMPPTIIKIIVKLLNVEMGIQYIYEKNYTITSFLLQFLVFFSRRMHNKSLIYKHPLVNLQEYSIKMRDSKTRTKKSDVVFDTDQIYVLAIGHLTNGRISNRTK